MKFGKVCEVLSWNLCTSTPLRSEQMVMREQVVRMEKDGTSAELAPAIRSEQKNGGEIPSNLLSNGKTP